jgi:ribonuclease HII
MLKSFYVKDDAVEVGVDEAGRGSFWGPLMAGAVIWPYEDDWTEEHREIVPLIKDSKKIKPSKRDMIYEHICNLAVDIGLGTVMANEIDMKGIGWANKEGFIRALNCLEVNPNRILLDGILEIEYGGSGGDGDGDKNTEIITIIEGDAQYISIAAASIVAKVEHDRWITEYCKSNPEIAKTYDLLNCKGYGTSRHRDGIYQFGLSEHHRRKFIHNKEDRMYTTDSFNTQSVAPDITPVITTAITDKCLF